MADLNWGALQKSSVDPETIEEAISRLILAHEADEEAHLGVGESLEAHKTSEVVDHLKGSIVADKMSMTEVLIKTDFESLDGIFKMGTYNQQFAGVELSVASGDVDYSKIAIIPEYAIYQKVFDKECLFEINLRLPDYAVGFNAWLGIGGGYSAGNDFILPNGFGFEFDNGVLYARVQRSTGNNREEITGLDFEVFHIFRAHYFPADELVTFYVDGVLVSSLSLPTGVAEDTPPAISFLLERDGSDEAKLDFSKLFCAFKII